VKDHPTCVSLQMETFQLLHLARISFGSIAAAACAIVLAQRRSGNFLDNKTKSELEITAGAACFKALSDWNCETNVPLTKITCFD